MADTPRKSSTNLDELEQDIRPGKDDLVGQPPSLPDDDPLAELARLVGEDNPFTRLGDFERKAEPRLDAEPTARVEPTVEPEVKDSEPDTESGDPSIFDDLAAELAADVGPGRTEPLVDDRFGSDAEREPSSNPFADRFESAPSRAAAPSDPSDNGPTVVDVPLDRSSARLDDDLPTPEKSSPASSFAEDFPALAPASGSTPDQEERRSPAFSPVLENPGQPKYEPVSRAEPVAARMEPEPRPAPVSDDDFEMPLDLSNAPEASEPKSAKIPEEMIEAGLAAGLAAAVSTSDARASQPAASAQKPSAPAPVQPKQAADDDPFAALEGALQREVDAVLRSGPETIPTPEEEAAAAAAEDDDDSPRRNRGMMIAAAVVGIMVLGGAGAFVYRGLVGTDGTDGDPVTITADGQALKERPADPGGTPVANQDALVFERAAGDTTGDDNAQIVPREEAVLPKAEDRVALGEGSRAQPRVIAPAPVQPGEDPNAPRRVRTMIVKPDGTIVRASEDSTTGTETAVAPLTPLPNATGEVSGQAPVVLAPPADSATATETVAITPEATAPASPDIALGPEDPNIPLPIPRPTNISANAAPAATAPAAPAQTATAPAAAPAQPAAQQVSIPGAYSVQLASRRSQEQALSAFASLQQQYPSILGNYQPFIERADLGGRGIFYRLRVGPLGSQANASQVCDQLRQAGLSDCLIRRN